MHKAFVHSGSCQSYKTNDLALPGVWLGGVQGRVGAPRWLAPCYLLCGWQEDSICRRRSRRSNRVSLGHWAELPCLALPFAATCSCISPSPA